MYHIGNSLQFYWAMKLKLRKILEIKSALLAVVLDIVSISSKLEVILRKRWQHLTEDQQQRINNFIHNVNVDGTKEILKTLGLKKEQLDMSLGTNKTFFVKTWMMN